MNELSKVYGVTVTNQGAGDRLHIPETVALHENPIPTECDPYFEEIGKYLWNNRQVKEERK